MILGADGMPVLHLTGRRSTPLIQQSGASECDPAYLAKVAGCQGLKIDLPAEVAENA